MNNLNQEELLDFINMNIKKFILTNFLIFLLCNAVVAQKVKFRTIGEALKEFMNSTKVIDNFNRNSQKGDSSIILIDLKNVIDDYPIEAWRGFKVTICNSGLLVDSLKLRDAHYLLKNRCNYYVLMSRKESKNVTAITLRHACTNVVSNTKVIEKNRLFYLGKIENAVW